MSSIDPEDASTWEPVNVPPQCPRCGGVHADVYQVAWDNDEDEYDREGR